MSSDVVTCLQLDKELTSRVLVVKEINGCDSSFVVSCVLGHCLRNKQAVFIISTHNSVHHYQNVGLKMNYNLDKFVQSGLLEFYNLGEDVLKNIMAGENNTIDDIFFKLKQRILLMQQKQDTVNVVVDGVTHLFDLQFNLKDINRFCANLNDTVTCYSNSFILYHCNDSTEDDVTHTLTNLLCHKAYTVLEVESLPSGWSADVSGHLTIRHPGETFDKEHMFLLDLKPTRYLFKLFDRGVKLFAPGTV